MNIILPEVFELHDERNNDIVAYVEDGMLYLDVEVEFKSLMKKLTYAIYGETCYWCKKQCKTSQITMDHIIPQDLGGPTITNNLLPACSKCNNDKSNLLPDQFELYQEIEDEEEKREFVRECQKLNEGFKYDKEFSLLDEYDVIMFPIKKIRGYKENNAYSDKKCTRKKLKQRRKRAHYEKYGRFQKAIIIDRNYHLLGGYESLAYASKISLKEVPVIILENVEVIYQDEENVLYY